MQKNLKPKKGDRAKFVSAIPAMRYMDRYGEVVRANNKNGTVILAFPTQRKSTMTARVSDLVFDRNGRQFYV